jgi:repressor LexA
VATKRQLDMLKAIVRLTKACGYPPTLKELGTELGIASTNCVAEHIAHLVTKGYVIRTPMVSRGLRVVRAA